MCSILQIKSESFDVEPTRYKLIDQLNSKGSICLFNDNVNNKQVVLKKFKSIFQSHDVTKAVLRELKILQLLKHESIINLVSILLPPNQSLFNDIYASFDHVDCPLAALIASPQVILLEHIQYFSFQIINAVDFLHTCGVMHCNLK